MLQNVKNWSCLYDATNQLWMWIHLMQAKFVLAGQ